MASGIHFSKYENRIKKVLINFLVVLGFTKFSLTIGKNYTSTGMLVDKLNETSSNSSSPLPIDRMNIQFTCNVCGTRNSKYFSRLAYTNGTVIIRCDGCRSHHVIADNLGWIQKMRGRKNIEEIFAEKGIKISRGQIGNVRFLRNHTMSYKSGNDYFNISYT